MNKKVNILIVEDELIVALDIQSEIESMGHKSLGIATNYNEVLELVAKNTPDIILMDINLQNSVSGIEIVEKLYEQNIKIPIIYLTAYTDEKTINKAIITNPIAYIVKPYKINELKATILLANYKINSTTYDTNTLIKIGDGYFYDNENEQLFYNQMPIKLSKKELGLLKLLLEAKGYIVTFKDIEYNLWDSVVSESTLRVLIYRLRNKLEHKFIETISSLGCKININN